MSASCAWDASATAGRHRTSAAEPRRSITQGYIERMSPEYEATIDSTKVKLNEMLSADEWLQGRIRSVHVTGRTK